MDDEKITEAREIAELYSHIDGADQKQYALVQIAKLLGSQVRFLDEGIPG
jgi:hypothetical protein